MRLLIPLLGRKCSAIIPGLEMGPAWAQGTSMYGAPGGLRQVASAKVFNDFNRNDVNRNDGSAALKVRVDPLGQQRGYLLDSHVDFVDTVTEIRERLQNHSVELLFLSISGHLKNKPGRAASFFASVKVGKKPQACILELFFGALEACVVGEITVDLAKELNPQLGQLRVLARSLPMTEGVNTTPAQPNPYRQELIDSILSLHNHPRGRQVLMVFKTDRLVA